jgi:hypothetical protein
VTDRKPCTRPRPERPGFPRLRTVTIRLAAALVAAGFLVRVEVSSVVQINQIVVGVAIALVSLVVAIDAGRWLG